MSLKNHSSPKKSKVLKTEFHFQTFKYFFVICVLSIGKTYGFLEKRTNSIKHWSVVTLTNNMFKE